MPAYPRFARDSCPHCGERPGLRWRDCLPQKYAQEVSCSACGKQCRLDGTSRLCGWLVLLSAPMLAVAIGDHTIGVVAFFIGMIPGILLGAIVTKAMAVLEVP
jgi:hypothetical protein